jgi:hypothetical protein
VVYKWTQKNVNGVSSLLGWMSTINKPLADENWHEDISSTNLHITLKRLSIKLTIINMAKKQDVDLYKKKWIKIQFLIKRQVLQKRSRLTWIIPQKFRVIALLDSKCMQRKWRILSSTRNSFFKNWRRVIYLLPSSCFLYMLHNIIKVRESYFGCKQFL